MEIASLQLKLCTGFANKHIKHYNITS